MARSIAAQALLPSFRRSSRGTGDADAAGPDAAPDVAHEPPVPPFALPPGRLVLVEGRGEFFVRDTGERDRPAVLLLHGWMFSADLNWFTAYDALHAAGHRVIALDHRGHGHGLRSPDPFRLQDCADDAAGVLHALDAGPALVVGYSLGGAVTQLLARDHADVVSGIVLCATANDWAEPKLRLLWSAMFGLRLVLGLSPEGIWRRVTTLMGAEGGLAPTWQAGELSRGSAVALAEAGRELGRFDSRPWNGDLTVPAAVVITRDDTSVPPTKQRALAASLGGVPMFEAPGTHGAVTMLPDSFNPVLLRAMAAVGEGATVPA